MKRSSWVHAHCIFQKRIGKGHLSDVVNDCSLDWTLSELLACIVNQRSFVSAHDVPCIPYQIFIKRIKIVWRTTYLLCYMGSVFFVLVAIDHWLFAFYSDFSTASEGSITRAHDDGHHFSDEELLMDDEVNQNDDDDDDMEKEFLVEVGNCIFSDYGKLFWGKFERNSSRMPTWDKKYQKSVPKGEFL